ncbi:hypothetical protein [Lederbergia galactosidilytica]|uniref:Uncharacterized protein n=1 Tax=Lederbergia galactosidilytica TaxID=217031 RepID=A0A0Q9XV69_9BACI|nr:hypothetical protein [Lederbergia galactosidilytica]KRG12656.1 hypothetical protein ACA29_10710 [Lederbergia galactosidilytica]KRG13005.1 hypothetical protein ACA30_17035 [Virgibacillus soli]MBP1917066.1 hypothetical protein [Lederbergia galactosidilytica]OAK70124.1 hypothetical protein ABB05_13190 [Lederbergia galactosidilytica]
MEFPVIHTNFWDGVIAVPLIVIITQLFKLFPIPRQYFPTIASILGFAISIFYSHRHNLWAGLFMGGFYSAAAVGTYSSLKTSWIAFKNRKKKSRNQNNK